LTKDDSLLTLLNERWFTHT